MAKSSVLEDLFAIASKIPWWIGLGLALATFAVLHVIAGQTLTAPTDPAKAGSFGIATFFVTLARYGQWILPIPLLLGAAVSAFQRRQRSTLHSRVAEAADPLALVDGLSWQAFEQLVGEAFRRRGFDVAETGGGADGGIDLVLRKGREKHFVQCKHWQSLQVGVAVVRELYGVMASKGAAGGYVVTSGRYTPDAIEFASGRNIELIDGRALAELIGSARHATGAATIETLLVGNADPLPRSSVGAETPACPRCGSPMVKRVAKRGATAGASFWGCSQYPKCRGVRQPDGQSRQAGMRFLPPRSTQSATEDPQRRPAPLQSGHQPGGHPCADWPDNQPVDRPSGADAHQRVRGVR